MLYGVIELTGKLLKHVLGVLLLCWQRMLRFGLSVGILSFIMAEVLGAALARQVPPSILTTVVALIVSFALGYAAALTALADELFLSAVDTIRLLEGDARAGFRAATAAAEREAGEAGQGLMRWLGHPPVAPSSGAVEAPAPAPRSASLEDAETREAIAATESFQNTAPRARVNARPVRADQLPRIPWAYEQDGAAPVAPAVTAAATAVAAAVEEPAAIAVPEMPPLPLREPDRVAPLSPATSSGSSDAVEEAAEALDDGPSSTLPAARTPEPEASPSADEPSIPTSATSTPQPVTESDPGASGDRSIWARIGQALVGNTMPLAALGGPHPLSAPSGPNPGGEGASSGPGDASQQAQSPDD